METKAVKTGATQPDGAQTEEPMVIPVIQEQVTFDKQVVETGQVRISKRIIEHEELVDVPLFREEVNVERVPVNQFVEVAPQVRQEGDTMIIPVVQEQIFYQKRLLLVEELRVKKHLIEEHKPQPVTLLREEVEITREAAGDNAPAGSHQDANGQGGF
jgi:uncharacterized protein (TIGR02271 family)